MKVHLTYYYMLNSCKMILYRVQFFACTIIVWSVLELSCLSTAVAVSACALRACGPDFDSRMEQMHVYFGSRCVHSYTRFTEVLSRKFFIIFTIKYIVIEKLITYSTPSGGLIADSKFF